MSAAAIGERHSAGGVWANSTATFPLEVLLLSVVHET